MAREDFIDWDRIGRYRVGIQVDESGLPSRIRIQIGRRSLEYIPDTKERCHVALSDRCLSCGEYGDM